MRMLRACLIAGTLVMTAGAASAQESDCDAVADELREALATIVKDYPRAHHGGYHTDEVAAYMQTVLPSSIPAACVEPVGINLREEPQSIVPPGDFYVTIAKDRLIITLEHREYLEIFGVKTGIRDLYMRIYFIIGEDGVLRNFLAISK